MKKTLIIALITFIYIKCDNTSNKNNTDITNGTGTSVVLYAPKLIYPLNSAAEIKLDITLIWNKVTISSNVSVKYTVYLSTVNPPVDKVSTSQSDTLFKPKLTLNTTYFWKVVAEDGNGNVKESEVRSFKTLAPPSVPILSSPSNNATNISLTFSLTWSAPITSSVGTVKYNVYIGNVNPPTSKVSTLQTLTSYVPNLTANTTYYWKIEAEDENGGVSVSEVRNFKTLVPPSIPILNLPINNATDVSISSNLEWSASTSSSQIIQYKVFIDTSEKFSSSLKVESNLQNGTSYAFTNLLSNAKYYWKIQVEDGNGGKAVSEIRNFKTIVVPPSIPNLSTPINNATNVSLTSNLIWSASTSTSGYGIKYNVYFSTSNPPTNKVSTLQTLLSYGPTLTANTTYYWKIEVDDGNGGTSVSEIWNFKTLVPPSVPVLTSPSNNATNVSLNTNLTWSASTTSSGGTIKYNVYLGTTSNPTTKVRSLQLGTTYTPTLAINTTYYWKIEADDGNGGVSVSEVRNFKTIVVPPSVPVLAYPSNNTTNVRLTSKLDWYASTSTSGGTIKYNVYFGTVDPPTTKVSSLQSGTTYTPTLTANTTYYWKIEADDGDGGTSVSEIRNFKTLVPPSVPVLTSPSNNATNVSLTSNLTWSASTSSSGGTVLNYNVYFGISSNPTTKVSNLGNSYKPILSANTTYYWKIEVVENGEVAVSEEWSFKTYNFGGVFEYEVVLVEGGTFTMGCTVEQGSDCKSDEKPSHSVTLSNFSIGKYEVTQAQWVSVIGSNPSYYTNPTCNDCPVEKVSWNDIQTFLTTLNTKTGKSYRLPTEAEWEYAARGGKMSSGYINSGSNDVGSVAWYNGNSSNKTHSVGTKTANELGIYDMSGNVNEWCSDWYDGSYYTSASVTNPTGPSTGTYKVFRGGSWVSGIVDSRVSSRYKVYPALYHETFGFRLVLP